VKPLLRIDQNSPAHLALRSLGFALVAYMLLSPLVRDLRPNELGELTDIVVLALCALALNLLIGFTGQISIGHSAFFGIGAYTTAILIDTHGWTPGWTFPAAALISFAVGVLVGIPALRLTGVYLTLVTLALAQIFPELVRKFDFTGGSFGITSLSYEPPGFTGIDTDRVGEAKWLYILGLFLLGLSYVVVRNLVKSRVGRAMVAVRDNTLAAGVMGVNVAVTKTVTFGLSAAIAGLGGSLYVLRQSQATPDDLNLTIIGAIIFLVIMVIGGTGSLLGPIVGAFVYYRVNDFTRELNSKTWLPDPVQNFLEGRANLATLVFAALLIILMFVAPFGLVGLAKTTARRIVQVVPRPPSSPPAPGVTAGPPQLATDPRPQEFPA
jgi:branched-chain amino acid transport system permease protein